MSASLVGSEMCIRDRCIAAAGPPGPRLPAAGCRNCAAMPESAEREGEAVSYTHLTLPTICSV
eukprot:3935675-Alexandrium_andersonii.AAC.1